MQRIDPVFKAKWTEALRSGKYKQFLEALRSPELDSYCCLGVACDIYDPDKWNTKQPWVYDYSAVKLPIWLLEKINLSPRDQSELMQMNDLGKTFDEIAGWIEQNL